MRSAIYVTMSENEKQAIGGDFGLSLSGNQEIEFVSICNVIGLKNLLAEEDLKVTMQE